MNRVCRRLLGGLLVLACASSGGLRAATSPEDAYAAWMHGAWADARRCGQALGTAEGYAISALARLSEAGHTGDRARQQAAVRAAVGDSRRALARDSDNITALLQAASAYGFRARWSRSFSDVRAARHYLERARDLDPDNALVLAGLGYWHGRTVLAAGGFWGGLFFGAGLDDALEAFEAALVQDPGNPAIRGGFGRLLLRFGESRLTGRGLRELGRAIAMTPQSALDRQVLDAARELLAMAESGAGLDDLAARATALAPFSDADR